MLGRRGLVPVEKRNRLLARAILATLAVGMIGVLIERTLLRRISASIRSTVCSSPSGSR